MNEQGPPTLTCSILRSPIANLEQAIMSGASVNHLIEVCTPDGWWTSPLIFLAHESCFVRHLCDKTQLLLQHRADPTKRSTITNRTALDYCLMGDGFGEICEPMVRLLREAETETRLQK